MSPHPGPLADHVSRIMESPIEVQALVASKGFLCRLIELKINPDCAITGIGIASYIQHMAGVVTALRRFSTALERAKEVGYAPAEDDEIDVLQSLKSSLDGNEMILREALGTLTSFVQAHDPEAPGYKPTCPIDAKPKEEKIPAPKIPDELKRFFN